MPRNQSEVPVAPAPEPKPIPCSPSAWWVKCQDCRACTTSVIYMKPHLLCWDCGGTLDLLDNGAVWGHEWATIVHMHNAILQYIQLEDEFDEYVGNNPEQAWND